MTPDEPVELLRSVAEEIRGLRYSLDKLRRRTAVNRIAIVLLAVLLAMTLWNTVRISTQRHENTVKINRLACFLVANTPDTIAPIVPRFRSIYHCPAFGDDPNIKQYPKTTPTASVSASRD